MIEKHVKYNPDKINCLERFKKMVLFFIAAGADAQQINEKYRREYLECTEVFGTAAGQVKN